MNRLLLLALSLFFCSCDKNKEISSYSEYYHIEDGVTLSYIIVPNAFTPDGDSINDFFYPIANNFGNDDFEWKVYNSNGEIIFSTQNQNEKWDGSFKGLSVENGDYYYMISATDFSGHKYDITGNLNLMR